jgi:hypothetical protein
MFKTDDIQFRIERERGSAPLLCSVRTPKPPLIEEETLLPSNHRHTKRKEIA